MRYLFVHDAFPGQFVHLLRALSRVEGTEIIAASRKGSTLNLPIEQIIYDVPVEALDNNGKPVFGMEPQGLGHDLYQKLKPKAEAGWHPDFIIVHASRGASFFLRHLFPNARITSFLEWYYRPVGTGDILGNMNHVQMQAFTNIHIKNMPIIRDFEQADVCYTPTQFQRTRFPLKWHTSIVVQHEGIDLDLYKPDPTAIFEVGGQTFDRSTEIITYAARGMEHARGFPQFMQAIAKVQKARPDTHVMIAAADRICYDAEKAPAGLKAWADENVAYDRARTHFVGLLPEHTFVRMLQISSLHTYLSIPFVLSWSCLNAMSVSVPVLASDTAPVREVITEGETGLLVDMDDVTAIADRMIAILDQKENAAKIGAAARQIIVERFALEDCTRHLLAIIQGAHAGAETAEPK